jgi:hypothetical protein
MYQTEDKTCGPTDKHTSHNRREFTNFLQASRNAVVGFIEAAYQNIYTSVLCRVVL